MKRCGGISADSRTRRIDLNAVIVSARIRKDMGGIEELAADIKEHGLINPITVLDKGNGQFVLIAGLRRLRACELLGMTHIRTTVCTTLEADGQLELEYAENEQRKQFTSAERLEYAEKIKEIERAKARERQLANINGGAYYPPSRCDRPVVATCPPLEADSHQSVDISSGKSRDVIARRAGFSSGRQYARIVKIAEVQPELLERIDSGEATVGSAYKELFLESKASGSVAEPGTTDESACAAGKDGGPPSPFGRNADQVARATHRRLMKNPIYAKLYADYQEATYAVNRARLAMEDAIHNCEKRALFDKTNIDALRRRCDELLAENAALRAQVNGPENTNDTSNTNEGAYLNA